MQTHDQAIIIASGDEIITGQLLDTNTRWIAQRLVDIGIVPVEHVTAPDELVALVDVLRRASARAPLVVMSGGLGPTEGDLTRAALAEVMGEELVMDEAARGAIRAMLRARAREMSGRQERQAFRPRSALCLANSVGTAPGLHAMVRVGGRGADVFCLPGPPGELRPMFEREVVRRLRLDPSRVVLTRLLHVVGVPEAECVERLGDLTERGRNPLVGITASGGVLTLRVRYEGTGPRERAQEALEEVEARTRGALGDHVVGAGDGSEAGATTLACAVLSALKERRATLAVVESCTGGMLGEMVTSIPGCSAAFLGGAITYANPVKVELGVRSATLEGHGAVSAETARDMAAAGLARFGATHALAITGIAGPDGGTAAKPVGTVFIALASRGGNADVRRFAVAGDREDIRRRTCTSALAMLHFALRGHAAGEPRLTWQVEP